ncbi:MAG TPA: cation:proton antiporter, partial [Polyangiaceae bacterium]|nr:cation:proton antiporter [Polyangiaceae bacterium]
MNAQPELLVDLTAALAAGAGGSFVATRLKLHPILGYLAAGIVIGPFTPGYTAHPETIETLATLGLVFFLFSLGLGVSPREMGSVGIRALLGNVAVMTVIAGLGAALGTLLGLEHPIAVGLLVAVSSTAVGNAVMEAQGLIGTGSGHFADAQLAFQDFASVALGFELPMHVAHSKFGSTAVALLKASGFVVGAVALGATLVERVARHVVARAAPETKLITGAAVALSAAWAGRGAGLSF